jgi:hypothetical protein
MCGPCCLSDTIASRNVYLIGNISRAAPDPATGRLKSSADFCYGKAVASHQ